MPLPVLIFDGRCSFCRIWIEYWKLRTGDRVRYAPAQEVASEFPQIPADAFKKAVQFVRPDGTYVGGARAVFELMDHPGIYAVPGVPAASEWAYRLIANHRDFFYHVTKYTFGTRIEPAQFALTQWLFLKLLAVVYMIAFWSLGVQVVGLIGEHGITPAREFFQNLAANLGTERYAAIPSVFWLNASDTALRLGCWAGVAFSLAAIAGYFQRIALIGMYVLYVSYSMAGQVFLGYQWDALLLEAGFLAMFFGNSEGQQRRVAWIYRWLVFRLYFLSGWVKLASGDPTWRGLTALDFHFHTQPLPTPLAWYADKLPASVLHANTWLVLAVELGSPFLIFAPRRWRMAAAYLMLTLQVMIIATGNYTFFNLLTMSLVLFLFDDQALRRWCTPPVPRESSTRLRMAGNAITGLLLVLGWLQLWNAVGGRVPGPIAFLSDTVSQFQVSNSYGLFAVMTTERPEIEVQGSDDGQTWRSYEFRDKPGDVRRAPPWVAPHQPRLDWQMWFAALGDARQSPWFSSFLERLLQGSPDVLGLLKSNPFADHPPKYIRAVEFQYSFSSRGQNGVWWTRTPAGEFFPAVSLR